MKRYRDARVLAESLVGKTILTLTRREPNTVLEVRDTQALVATGDAPHGEPVELSELQRGIDLLMRAGDVRVHPETFGGYRRSSFIGAVLGTLPAVEVTAPPTHVRLRTHAPLRDALRRACASIAQPRTTTKVVASDPFHRLMRRELPGALQGVIDDRAGYLVRGSAGQLNFVWAETAWVAIFDRLVTESAQRGHYLVLLVPAGGHGVFLSLNQGMTEVRAAAGSSYRDRLLRQASQFRGRLPREAMSGMIVDPLDLGGTGARTRGYEAGNIAALYMSVEGIPHDAMLGVHLARLLQLYEMTTAASVDEEATYASLAPSWERLSSIERKRYRWHFRVEGRNRTVVKRAKQLQGYVCCVCERDFVQELGELGKRCVDAHHLTPFSDLDERPRALDPRTDFAIVCANCHRMLHSVNPPLLPSVLSRRLRSA